MTLNDYLSVNSVSLCNVAIGCTKRCPGYWWYLSNYHLLPVKVWDQIRGFQIDTIEFDTDGDLIIDLDDWMSDYLGCGE